MNPNQIKKGHDSPFSLWGSISLLYLLGALWPWIEYTSLLSEILEQTRIHVGALAIATGIVLVAKRRWIASAIIFTGVTISLTWISSSYSHSQQKITTPVASTDTLKILSFNAYIKNRDARSIIEIVKRYDPDILLLIEANPELRKLVVEGLHETHPHHTKSSRNSHFSELMAISKYKLSESENYLRIGSQAQRVLFTPIEFNGSKINLYGIHTLSPISKGGATTERIAVRHRQINQLISHIATENGDVPFIIAGDLNSAPWHTSMRGLQTVLKAHNANHLPAISLTWPTWVPRLLAFPIDHIYHSQTLCSLRSSSIDIDGSDHRAVYADLTLCLED